MYEVLFVVAKLAGMAIVGAAAIAVGAYVFRAVASVAMAVLMLEGVSGRSIRNGALIGAGLGLAIAAIVPWAPVEMLAYWAACGAVSAMLMQFIAAVIRLNMRDAHALSVMVQFADNRLAQGSFSTKLYD